MIRYHALYDDFNGSDLNWAMMAASKLKRDEWDESTPFLFDGSMWNDTLCEKAAVGLLNALRQNTSVNAVLLRNWIVGRAAEQALAETFHEQSCVKSFGIKNVVQQSTQLPISLPAGIFKNRALREVTLEGCFLEQAACLELATSIRSKECKLRSIVFKSVTFEEAGLHALHEAIAENKSLRYVTMRCMKQISVDSICQLLSSFAENSCIQLLELEEMNLNEQHADSIASLLARNTQIRILSIRKNSLNADAIQTIMRDGLTSNSSLKTLYLSENRIGDDGIDSIVTCMKQNSTLENLCLKSCGFHREGCKTIAKGIALFAGLKYLNVEMNKQMESCSFDVLKSLNKNHVIESIICDRRSRLHRRHGMVQDAIIWSKIEYYLRLNRTNRRAIKDLNAMNSSLTVHFLAQPKISLQPDVMFHFLENMSALYHPSTITSSQTCT